MIYNIVDGHQDNETQDGSYWALFSYNPNPIQIDFSAVAGRQVFSTASSAELAWVAFSFFDCQTKFRD